MKTAGNIFAKTSLTLLLTLLLFNFVPQQTKAQVKSSKIFFEETEHDFGKVQQGKTLSYDYKFKNDGEGNLLVKKVRASCGCTGASIGDKKDFKSGEEGEIKVTFNTSGRRGVQNKTVSVQTNDPNKPMVILSFTCDVISE